MLKKALFLVLICAVVFLPGCDGGGGGGSVEFNFQGTWPLEVLVTASTNPSVRAGTRGTDFFVIDQLSDDTLRLRTSLSGVIFTGPCDPVAGTFTASAVREGVAMTIYGNAVNPNTMEGTMIFIGPGGRIDSAWTGSLYSRAISAFAVPGGNGKALTEILRKIGS